jgi:hypothetical protein
MEIRRSEPRLDRNARFEYRSLRMPILHSIRGYRPVSSCHDNTLIFPSKTIGEVVTGPFEEENRALEEQFDGKPALCKFLFVCKKVTKF